MSSQAPVRRERMFLDIRTAAEMAGFSLRHFRRLIEEDGVPVLQIGRKLFIMKTEFEAWHSSRRNKADSASTTIVDAPPKNS